MKLIFTSVIILIFNMATAQTTYHNKAFGILAIMPQGWFKGSNSDTTKNLELTDQLRTNMLIEKGSVYLTDYFNGIASSKGGLTPKIQINTVLKTEKTFAEFKKETIRSAELLKKDLDNFQYLQRPAEINISGIKSLYFIIKYDMVVMGKKMHIRNHTYAIPYKNYLFHISLVDGETENCTEAFEKFIKTIKIGF